MERRNRLLSIFFIINGFMVCKRLTNIFLRAYFQGAEKASFMGLFPIALLISSFCAFEKCL